METMNKGISDMCLTEDLDILHPEIMTVSQLCYLLKRRNIPLEDSIATNKESLLELYCRTILPLPQRECRQNRRGQLIQRNRLKELKRKPEASLPDTEQLSEPICKLLRMSISSSATETFSRLKPPPSPVSRDKTVRLDASSLNGSSVSRIDRKIGSKSDKNVIKLINDTLMSSAEQNINGDCRKCPGKNKMDQDGESPKKKHKPITWP